MSDALARLHELSLLKDPTYPDIPLLCTVTVRVAKNLIENDLSKLPFKLYLYPTYEDGGVSIQFNTEHLCFEIEVVAKYVTLFVFTDKTQLEQKFNFEQLKELVQMNKEQFGEFVNG